MTTRTGYIYQSCQPPGYVYQAKPPFYSKTPCILEEPDPCPICLPIDPWVDDGPGDGDSGDKSQVPIIIDRPQVRATMAYLEHKAQHSDYWLMMYKLHMAEARALLNLRLVH